MQAHVVCECGNEVTCRADQANGEYRCQRCGRRVFANDDDAKAFFDIALSIDGDYQTPVATNANLCKTPTGSTSTPIVHHSVPNSPHSEPLDPNATVAQSVQMPIADKKNHAADAMTTIISEHASVAQNDDFEVPHRPPHDSSSLVWNGDSGTPKYDLSQRVMRPIAKPALPAIPYSGGGEYGIHRILRIHQRGGMGRILVAYDQYLKRDVAIKELHPDVAEDESIVRRFIGEAEITAQLEHPGVVPIHRLGQGHDGLPYYTMKMIKGETLQDAIKAYHRKPSQQELLTLVRRLVSVAKTMAFAHSKGVIHRDLKPANIMIGEHGETLVMDWGLAKPFDQDIEDSYISIIHQTKQPRPELTMVGAIVGTPAFMSPEQAMAEENMVGPLSDVFSLGTVLYYLLAGQTAFSGRSTQEVLNKVRAAVVIPPSQIKSNVPHGLELICLKAMSKLPEDRYQGATAFSDDLCRWLDGEPIAAEKNSYFTKCRRWVQHHRVLSIGLPIILCLLVLWTGINLWMTSLFPHAVLATPNSSHPLEFSASIQVAGSPGTRVWTTYRPMGTLLLSCQVEPTETENQRIVSIYPPDGSVWDLTQRDSLTFSLLTIAPAAAENDPEWQNFCIRLGQGESYYEYKPSTSLLDSRNQTDWQHFTVSLHQDSENWRRENVGTPNLLQIEWLEIRFDTKSALILNVDNLKFIGESDIMR